MRTAVLVLFGVVAAVVCSGGAGAAAPVPKHLAKEPESDKAKFQGKWKVESMKMGGKDVLPAELGLNIEMTIEFRDDQVVATVNIAGMFQKTTGTVTYGVGGKRQIKLANGQTVDKDGKPIDNGGPKDSTTGYAFDGDKLLIASASDGTTSADPLKPGANDIVMVLVRVKEK